MYDLIYGNGDSFTAGEDLIDHLYMTNKDRCSWLEWTSTPTLHAKYQNCRRAWHKKNPTINIDLLQRERTYIHHLGKITNTPTINNAQSGSGHTKISMTTLDDLSKLKQKYNKILCVISLTCTMRLWFPNNGIVTGMSDTLVLGSRSLESHSLLNSRFLSRLTKVYITNSTDQEWMLQFFAAYLGIIKFCEYNNIDLAFVGSPIMNTHHFRGFTTDGYSDLISPVEQKCVCTLGGPNIENLKRDKSQKIFSLGGHLTENYHIQTAHELQEIFWK